MNYKEARQQFAVKVSQLRREKRMTQDELAELIETMLLMVKEKNTNLKQSIFHLIAVVV